jgi:hypothetical protein
MFGFITAQNHPQHTAPPAETCFRNKQGFLRDATFSCLGAALVICHQAKRNHVQQCQNRNDDDHRGIHIFSFTVPSLS